jgi:hypothetical protein
VWFRKHCLILSPEAQFSGCDVAEKCLKIIELAGIIEILTLKSF